MSRKALEVTEAMLDQIARVAGVTLRADEIVVYQAAAMSTKPLTKPGTIFDGAVATRELLLEAAQGVRSGEISVPLHTLHQQGGELPVGRVFDAWVEDQQDGSSVLVAQFYLPKSEAAIIDKINVGVLDEVSVGFVLGEGRCSKCGFDYFAPDSWEAIFTQTCENGHTIGQDGTHLRMTALATWSELSLVSRGAAHKPKILSRPKQVMASDAYDRLAASGVPVEARVVYLSTNIQEKCMEKPENKAGVELAAETVAALVAEAVQAAIAPLAEKLESLEAKEPEQEVDVEALKAELEAAKARIEELEANASNENQGEPQENADPTGKGEAASSQEVGVPAGGVAASAVTDAIPAAKMLAATVAFKTPKRR